jgi:hypothetical protein
MNSISRALPPAASGESGCYDSNWIKPLWFVGGVESGNYMAGIFETATVEPVWGRCENIGPRKAILPVPVDFVRGNA